MNKKIIKRILIIILLFMIFVVAYKLVNTYALFYSEGNGVIEQKMPHGEFMSTTKI